MAKCLNAKNNTAKPTRGVSIFLLIQKQANVYYMMMEILKRWKVTMEHQSIAVRLWIFCHRLCRAILIIWSAIGYTWYIFCPFYLRCFSTKQLEKPSSWRHGSWWWRKFERFHNNHKGRSLVRKSSARLIIIFIQ